MKNRKDTFTPEELQDEKQAAFIYAILVLVTGVAFVAGVIAGSSWFYFSSGLAGKF
ncbi:hypothetical protein [Cyclobacterium marinum]|uniref:hypothetical protein n=1 Tax=Cyclobacterium marinum TaxID=104 RepID=UPI0030D9D233